MRADFNNTLSRKWFRMLSFALFMILVGSQSSFATSGNPDNSDNPEPEPTWFAVIMAPEIMNEVEAVGDNWIALQYLSSSGMPDSSYDGFLLRPANCALTIHKEILNKFIHEGDDIYNRENYEKITVEDFKAMPINKIMSIMIIPNVEGKRSIRVNLNNKGFNQNPLTSLAIDLSVSEKYRMWSICNEPLLNEPNSAE